MTTQYGFYFDSTRCTGCKTCVLACKDYQSLEPELSYRRVFDYEGGSWQQGANGTWEQNVFVYHVSLACNHCNYPICVQVCPTGAMHKESNGIVRVNTKVCVGCGYCMLSCPYRAPTISNSTHVSSKCDGCYSRIFEGKKPICVEACPLRALDFADIAQLRQKHGSRTSLAPMPDPSFTLPNIVIKPCLVAREPGDTKGFVANETEV